MPIQARPGNGKRYSFFFSQVRSTDVSTTRTDWKPRLHFSVTPIELPSLCHTNVLAITYASCFSVLHKTRGWEYRLCLMLFSKSVKSFLTRRKIFTTLFFCIWIHFFSIFSGVFTFHFFVFRRKKRAIHWDYLGEILFHNLFRRCWIFQK